MASVNTSHGPWVVPALLWARRWGRARSLGETAGGQGSRWWGEGPRRGLHARRLEGSPGGRTEPWATGEPAPRVQSPERSAGSSVTPGGRGEGTPLPGPGQRGATRTRQDHTCGANGGLWAHRKREPSPCRRPLESVQDGPVASPCSSGGGVCDPGGSVTRGEVCDPRGSVTRGG